MNQLPFTIDKTLFVRHVKPLNGSSRYIDALFSVRSFLDFNEVLDLETSFAQLKISNNLIGEFDSVEDIQKFCLLLSEKMKFHGICLIDTETFNRGVSEVKQVTKLNQFFYQNGELIKNPENKKKGLFSNFL